MQIDKLNNLSPYNLNIPKDEKIIHPKLVNWIKDLMSVKMDEKYKFYVYFFLFVSFLRTKKKKRIKLKFEQK